MTGPSPLSWVEVCRSEQTLLKWNNIRKVDAVYDILIFHTADLTVCSGLDREFSQTLDMWPLFSRSYAGVHSAPVQQCSAHMRVNVRLPQQRERASRGEQACRAQVHDVGTVRLVTVPQASCISPVRAAANRVASSAGMVKAKARWPSRIYSIHTLPSLYVKRVS